MGFFWEKECVGAPQRPLGFATTLNMWDLVGCLFISACIYMFTHNPLTSLNCYWLYFERYFEWFRIGITN
jgi:hypothetical protein